MNSKSFAIVMVLILAVTLCVLPTTDAQAVMPVGPCTAILDTNGVPTGAFTPGCGGDSGFFWHAQFPALYILIAAMLYRDLTIQQIEGFPGQQWDTCANPNPPDACYVPRPVLSPWLWKAPHHEPTGQMESFLKRYSPRPSTTHAGWTSPEQEAYYTYK